MTDYLPSAVDALRTVEAAALALRTYGAALPPEVETARALYVATKRTPPAAPDLLTIGAQALDHDPTKAGKALVAARVAEEVHRAALAVAAQRTRRALIEHADDVIAAVLGSAVIAEAVATIARTAPNVSPNVSRNPAPSEGGENLDAVIGAATLRKAEAVFERAAQSLTANDDLGVAFEDRPLGLLWIDPSKVEDFRALRHALGGWKRDAQPIQPYVVQANGSTGVPLRDPRPLGIVSATAAAVPGVEFTACRTFDEFEQRERIVQRSQSKAS